jgi:NADH:ubiquinone oxidoreductase subunit 3 (subunit A)
MRHLVLKGTCRKGVALLMVILIAALALVGAMAALSFIRPRTAMVKGQSASDRALSCADGMIDRLLDQINGFGLAYEATTDPVTNPDATTAMDEVLLSCYRGSMALVRTVEPTLLT